MLCKYSFWQYIAFLFMIPVWAKRKKKERESKIEKKKIREMPSRVWVYKPVGSVVFNSFFYLKMMFWTSWLNSPIPILGITNRSFFARQWMLMSCPARILSAKTLQEVAALLGPSPSFQNHWMASATFLWGQHTCSEYQFACASGFPGGDFYCFPKHEIWTLVFPDVRLAKSP